MAVFLNRTVCGTSASAQSCTREVKFYRGDSDMMDRRTGKLSKQKINVIDTIGMYVEKFYQQKFKKNLKFDSIILEQVK